MSQTTCFQPKRGCCAAAVAAAIAAVLAGLVAAGDGDVGHGFADCRDALESDPRGVEGTDSKMLDRPLP